MSDQDGIRYFFTLLITYLSSSYKGYLSFQGVDAEFPKIGDLTSSKERKY
jgi:hypothetical protein